MKNMETLYHNFIYLVGILRPATVYDRFFVIWADHSSILNSGFMLYTTKVQNELCERINNNSTFLMFLFNQPFVSTYNFHTNNTIFQVDIHFLKMNNELSNI